MKVSKTQYLASFMVGLGSIFNVAPVFANIGNVGSLQDDKCNLKKDWQNVGHYLYTAMDQVNNGKEGNKNRK